MNICIVGCGALGGIFGGHLALHKDITLWAYDTNTTVVDALNKRGLRLVGGSQCTVEVRATSTASELPPCQIGIVATKHAHTRKAIEQTAHCFRDGLVCSVQNGIGNEEIIAEHVDRVLSGTTMLGGHIIEPGLIYFDTRGPTWLGPASESATVEDAQALAALLDAQGLETHALPDPRGIKWSKLVFNASANALCALTGLTFGEMYQRPDLRRTMYGVAEEGMAVARALGITLHSDPVALLDKAATEAHTHVPSMLSDVRHRTPTEVGALNGGIARLGMQSGVACPLNQTLLALVEGVEQSWESQRGE